MTQKNNFSERWTGKLSDLKRLTHLIMWILVPLIVWSCSDNSSGPGNLGTLNPGSFEGSVTGAETQSFSGVSIFGTQQLGPPTGDIFVMTLSSLANNPNYSVSITIRGSKRLSTGVHTIENYGSERAGQFVVMVSQQEFRAYGSTGGAMTISHSTAESLRGEITFEAELLNDPDKKVTVNARFNANCQQISVITCD